MKENIQTTRLENGLTILTEKMPDARSATVGIWIKRGSRHEPFELNGISHFIEHAVFKGTRRRSALDIAIEIDRLGGNLDAFTMHEAVGFMAKVVDTQILNTLDLISDMLADPLFDERELKREQKVIIEEIKMVEDTPEDILSEIFTKEFFPNSPLGLPIEGTKKTVRQFNRETTRAFHAELCQPKNIVVACAGNVEHYQVVEFVNSVFATQKTINSTTEDSSVPETSAPIFLKKNRNLEQAHLLIAAPWIGATDERRYAANLLISILGDGNSSRLWQTIREKRGLAYSVGASASSFQDCGIFSIYAGTSPDKLGEVIDLSVAEIRKIKQKGVSEEELSLAKQQITASVLLGLEDSAARAANLAQQEMIYGKQISVEETLRKLEAVTAEEVKKLAEDFFQTEKMALGALGNLNGLKINRSRLEV